MGEDGHGMGSLMAPIWRGSAPAASLAEGPAGMGAGQDWNKGGARRFRRVDHAPRTGRASAGGGLAAGGNAILERAAIAARQRIGLLPMMAKIDMMAKIEAAARIALVAGLLALPGAALAQASPPAGTLTQDNPPQSPPGADAAKPLPALPRATLIPQAGDPVDVDEVVIPDRPVVIAAGTSTWDEAFVNLRAAFRRVEDGIAKSGLRAAGRPIAVFVETDDTSFHYEAMIPIDQSPPGQPQLPPGLRLGATPAGKAFRFVHKGPYDDIDSTYETITTYLDAKGVAAKDAFIEEYATDAADSADTGLEINIFVQPK